MVADFCNVSVLRSPIFEEYPFSNPIFSWMNPFWKQHNFSENRYKGTKTENVHEVYTRSVTIFLQHILSYFQVHINAYVFTFSHTHLHAPLQSDTAVFGKILLNFIVKIFSQIRLYWFQLANLTQLTLKSFNEIHFKISP